MLLYTAAGFWLTPYLLHRQLTGYVTDTLGRQLTIEKIAVNPFNFKLNIQGLNLAESDGEKILSFDRLLVDFAAKSLFHWAWTFTAVTLENPGLHIDVDPEGRLNLLRLADDAAPADEKLSPPPSDGPKSMPRLVFESLRLDNGRVVFSDRSDATTAESVVTPINLAIENLSTLPDREGQNRLQAKLSDGGQLVLSGGTSLQPMKSMGRLELTGLKPGAVWKFLQDELNMDEPLGSLSVEADYRFAMEKGKPQLVLTGVHYKAKDLAFSLKGAETPALVLGDAELTGGRYDLAANHLTVERLTYTDGRLHVLTSAAGRLNWTELFSGSESNADEIQPASADAVPPRDMTIDIRSVKLNNIAVNYEDRSRPEGVQVALGRIDAGCALLMEKKAGDLKMGLDLSELSIADSELRQAGSDQALMQLQETVLKNGKVDITGSRIELDRIDLKNGHLVVDRTPDGHINWQRLAEKQETEDRPAAAPDDNTIEETNVPWHIRVANANLVDFSVEFTDRTLPEPQPYRLQEIRLSLQDIDTAANPIAFDLSLASAPGGSAAVKGTVDLSPFKMQSSLKIDEWNLTPLQPYLAQFVRLRLDSGLLSISGDTAFSSSEASKLRFKGGLGIDQFRMTPFDSDVPLVGWRAATMEGIDVDGIQNGFRAERLKFEEPFGELAIDSEQKLNISQLAVARPVSAEPEAQPDQADEKDGPFPVKIKRIDIKDGRLLFSDMSLPLPFKADIHQLKGVISGVASDPASDVAMALDGRVQDYGEVTIKGDLKPFDPKVSTDVGLAFRNLEMTDLTPYTAKFAGRRIKSGKLSLDLHYKVKQSQLQGDNQIVTDRLELGERIESPKAMDLPLELALALLEDSSGRIDIGLPVTGDLENPEFSIGHLVWKALGNLLKKIVTAPFRALGALIGMGEKDLESVGFPAGVADLPPPEAEKLTAVAKALNRRPQLKLTVRGAYDTRADATAIKDLALRREVVTATGIKLAEGEDPGPVNFSDADVRKAVTTLASGRLTPAELKAVERPGSTDKDKTAKDKSKSTVPKEDLPDTYYAAIYGKLLETIDVPEAELVSLASKRAAAVRATLTEGKVADERISIGEPLSNSSEKSRLILCPMELSAGGAK